MNGSTIAIKEIHIVRLLHPSSIIGMKELYEELKIRDQCKLKKNLSLSTNCTVKSDVFCLGKRKFFKNLRCNWTSGYRWSTALILSITLGGFGADR